MAVRPFETSVLRVMRGAPQLPGLLVLLALVASPRSSAGRLVLAQPRSIDGRPAILTIPTSGSERERAPQAPPHVQDLGTLEPGRAIERPLSRGEVHAYEIWLTQDQYLHVVIDQRGIYVTATLLGPDGRSVARISPFDPIEGSLSIVAIAPAPGRYRLQVRAVGSPGQAGHYELRIAELGAATAENRDRVAAREALAQGERLARAAWAEGAAGGAAPRALETLAEALLRLRAVDDRPGAFTTLCTLGALYGRLGDAPTALGYLEDAVAAGHSLGNRHLEAKALTLIASVYRVLDEPQLALDAAGQALALWLDVNDTRWEATTLNGLGAIYESLGEHERALKYFSQALQNRRAAEDRLGQATSLANTGRIYEALDEPRHALDSYSLALPLMQAAGDRRQAAYIVTSIAASHAVLGDDQAALDAYGRALAVLRDVGDRHGEAVALNGIGRVHTKIGALERAFECFSEVLRIARAGGGHAVEAGALFGLARVQRDSGDLLEAKASSEAALAILDSVRTKVESEDLRASYVASVQEHYDFHVDLLMRLHQLAPEEGFDAAALQAAERARARGLLEMLADSQADIRQGADPILLERERMLRRVLNAKAERQVRLSSSPHTPDEATSAAMETARELDALTADLQQVEGRIRATSPRYAALMQPQTLSWQEIRHEVLDADTVLLEYWLGTERSYVWVGTPAALETFELPARRRLEAAATRASDLLKSRPTREFSRQTELALSELSRMVLGPVAGQLQRQRQRLIIVGDGALQYVPFGALPSPASGRPLVVDHEIVNVPSASVLVQLRREETGRPQAPKAVAVLSDPVFEPEDPRVRHGHRGTSGTRVASAASSEGDGIRQAHAEPQEHEPRSRAALTRSAGDSGLERFERLPFSRQEADIIERMAAPDRVLKAVDFMASKATVLGAGIGEFRIVHLATHGLIDSRHPELSGIVLSLVDEQGRPQDGFLRAHEIYNLKLGADLVVLSACRTALGKEIKGEGLIGLTRGFMYAGVPRVVASLWDIRDEAAAELMKRFYARMLKDHLRPAAALRAAQVSMWREPRWRAPYYWAAFVIQGESR